MIAVKYRKDISFTWPQTVRQGISKLPKGFDEILTPEQYYQMIADNQSSFDAMVAELESERKAIRTAEKFESVRKKVEKLIKKYQLKGRPKKYQDFADILPEIPSSIRGQDKQGLESEITAILEKEL